MTGRSPTVMASEKIGPPSTSWSNSIVSLLIYASFGALVLLVAVAGGLSTHPMLVGGVIGLLLMLPIIWNRPSFGAYLLMGGAAVFEAFPLGFRDSITDQAVFFQSFSSQGAPQAIIVSAAEILMVFTLVTVVLRRIAERRTPLELGPMFWAIGFYTVMVGFGFVYGVGTGGNWNSALWEARGQVYLFVVYLLVINTIHERRQVSRLFWIFLAGVALKGLIGTWRYLVTLEGDLDGIKEAARNANSILSHEESYLFALFFLFAFILFLFRGHRGQLWFVLITSTPVLLAFVANQRRVGSLALMLGTLVVVLLAYRLLKSRRNAILNTGIALVILVPIYMAITWNTTGLVAEPTRAVKSLIQPNERDASSNDYREIENLNLKYNIQIDPIKGRGYGKPIIFYVPLPDISALFYWWDIIPHNTILWVWMRLGVVGFSAFWFFIGRAIVGSIMVTKQSSDPYMQSVGVFTVAALFTWVLMGLVDMGLVDFRETTLMGLFIGLVSRIPQIEQSATEEHEENESSHIGLTKPRVAPHL